MNFITVTVPLEYLTNLTDDICFKAVSWKPGQNYVKSLGMGRARRRLYFFGEWTSPTRYGISVARTIAGARSVIELAKQRKVLKVPKHMRVVMVLGRGMIGQNKWRVTFRQIKVMGVIGK